MWSSTSFGPQLLPSKYVSFHNSLIIPSSSSLYSRVIDCALNKRGKQQKEIKMNTLFQLENLKGSRPLRDISGGIILKWMLKICIDGVLRGRQIFYALSTMENSTIWVSIILSQRRLLASVRSRVQTFPAWHTKAAPNGKCCEGYIVPSMVRLMYQLKSVLK